VDPVVSSNYSLGAMVSLYSGRTVPSWRFVVLLLLLLQLLQTKGETEEIVAREKDTVTLECPVKTSECGAYHSMKWYRDNSRVFVYSPLAGFKNPEEALMDRCLDITQAHLGRDCPRGSLEDTEEMVTLTVSPIKLEDEGEYRCEITYLDVSNDCPVVHITNVKTIAPPQHMTITVNDDSEDMTDQVAGPFAADTEVSFVCKSWGGKPAPSLEWTVGEQQMEGDQTVDENEATNTLTLTLNRDHTGTNIVCKAEHEALEEEMSAQMEIDVKLVVNNIELDESTLLGVENEEMNILCRASGANPAASLEMRLHGDDLVYEKEETVTQQEDGTFETVGKIIFTPTSNEDGIEVECEAINEVMEEAVTASSNLTVHYTPEVTHDEDVTVVAGEDATLECVVNANPDELNRVDWFHEEEMLDKEDERYQFEGNTLVILSTVSEDKGRYSCLAENVIGEGRSDSPLELFVFYPPTVSVSLSPSHPVVEKSSQSVVLQCEVLGGNPKNVSGVTWYRDGEVISVKPDPEMCGEDTTKEHDPEVDAFWDIWQQSSLIKGDPCTDDLDILELVIVTREDAGNYSCVGRNMAGDGERSEEVVLEVEYLPGQATIQAEMDSLKGEDQWLSCSVEEEGNPETTHWVWTKNDEELEEKSSNLTLTSLGLEHQANYSCAAVNHVGTGDRDTLYLEVEALPTFLVSLPEETTFVIGDELPSLQCQVECSPLCGVEWLLGDRVLTGHEKHYIVTEKEEEEEEEEDEEDTLTSSWMNIPELGEFIEEDLYLIEEEEVEEDWENNQFTSVISTLTWLHLSNNEENFTVGCRPKYEEYEGNYSETWVTVHYRPGPAEISLSDSPFKSEPISLLCSVSDLGRPEAEEYIWIKNDEELEEKSSNLTLISLGLEDEANYSCAAVNHVGTGENGTWELNVEAPPVFLISLSDGTTFVVGEELPSLQCQVECSPLCSLEWVVEDEVVTEEMDQYRIEEEEVMEDVENNQFSSVISTLKWNYLNISGENFTVACRVSGRPLAEELPVEEGFLTDTGTGEKHYWDSVESNTNVSVEGQPDAVEIQPEADLELEEGERMEAVICTGEGFPEPEIQWKTESGEIVGDGGILNFTDTVTRHQTGSYSCHVTNKHGELTSSVFLSVMYKPDCSITHHLEDEEMVLQCTADANPKDVGFYWSRDDVPMSGSEGEDQLTNILRLDLNDNETTGLYNCYVNNSMGYGECQLDLTASMLAMPVDIPLIIGIVGGVLAGLLLLLFCCYCHRKHNPPRSKKAAGGKVQASPAGENNQGPKADKSFYENLPFHGLKNPPKQVLNPKSDDFLDYADADFKDLKNPGDTGAKQL